MKLWRLCESVGLEAPAAHRELEIRCIVTNSKEATAGSLYICICGLRTDGHRYIREAVANGAVCVLTEKGSVAEVPSTICRLITVNTRRMCALLFNAFYGNPCERMKFIGITGTNGKTSVSYLIRRILEDFGYRCGLIGTVGCESVGRVLKSAGGDPLSNMTTPDPPQLYRLLWEMAEDGVEYVIMEATSHALALDKLAPIRFDVGIFTNLTPEHLDFHGTMDDYADAKAKLFAACGLSILNGDSPFARRMETAGSGRVVRCGEYNGDYRAERVEHLGQSGIRYELVAPDCRLCIQCPVPGSFTLMNSLQAAACALELGVSANAVQTALRTVNAAKGRMERLRIGVDADFEVIIDYAHTPDALEKLLRTAKSLCRRGERLVLLFGCGGDRDRGKRPVMGALAERYADAVILTADNSRSEHPEEIICEIRAGMSDGKEIVIPDRRNAIRYAVFSAKKGDLILLAGKGHEEYEINRDGRVRFSEREIVAEAISERRAARDKNGHGS